MIEKLGSYLSQEHYTRHISEQSEKSDPERISSVLRSGSLPFYSMKGIIYKATNRFDGKVYIGQTVGTLAKRRREHFKDARSDSENNFHWALSQFGRDGFDWEVIETFEGTREEVAHSLNVAEEYNIMRYDSTNPDRGYNSTMGGLTNKIVPHVAERMRQFQGAKRILQYGLDGNFIKEFESLNAVATHLNKDKIQARVLCSGAHYGFQWRIKDREAFPMSITPYIMPTKPTVHILAYDSEGRFVKEYKSVAEAEAEHGNITIRKTTDSLLLPEHRLRDYYFFRKGSNNYPESITVTVKRKIARKPNETQAIKVLLYDENGNFVKQYPSMNEAGRICHTSGETISRACRKPEPYVIGVNESHQVWRWKDGEIREHIDVIIQEKKGKRIKTGSRHILQYDNQGNLMLEWNSVKEAARTIGISASRIYASLSYERDTEYAWRWKDGETLPPCIKTTDSTPSAKHAILQYSLKGEYIKTWDNTLQAVNAKQDSMSLIRKELAGEKHRKTTNYQWRKYQPDFPLRIAEYPDNSRNV